MLVPSPIAPVFIGYRRTDTGDAAGRLRDALETRGHDVWLDLRKIDDGTPYREAIAQALRECECALILIGPQWATVTGRDGGRRIDDPEDDVRKEVQLALARPDITLVPVLVNEASMPRRDELPEDLRGMCELSGAPLRQDMWPHCVDRLHHTIQRSARRGRRAWGEALVVAAVAAVPAALLAATDGLSTTTAHLDATDKTLRLVAQRAALWALIMGPVIAWVALRRPGHRWGRALRAGLLWGALFGVLGALVHSALTYVIKRPTWEGWGVQGDDLKTVRSVSYALGVAVTGAGIGALVGAAWNPPGVKRGLIAGLIAGGALGVYVHDVIGDSSDGAKIRTAILIAVGVVAVAIATEWLSRAVTTRGSP
jgi:hypothetical protein